MVSVQSTESKDNLPRFEFISPSLIVLEKQIKNREDGSIQKVRILPVSQQAGNILPSEFRTDDRSKILLEQIRGSGRFSQILSQIQGIDHKELEKFLDEKFLGRNTSYDEDRWEGLLIFFRKPDGTIDYEKLAAWIVYNLDHLKGVSIFRDSLFFDQKSLEPGVWGHLYEFIRSDTDYKIITIPLQGNLSLTIQRDGGGFFIPPGSLKDPKSLKFIDLRQKTYITTNGIVLFIMGGQLYGITVESKEKLAEIYKSLRENGVDTIYYLYSGDYVKENEGRKEKGIRLEILSDTLDRPKILSDRERVNAVYHGNRIIQSFHALKDGRPVIVQIATMKDTKGVLYQHYRIIEANGSYNIFQGWQRLSEESFGERENGERGNLAEVKLQDGKKLRDRILYGNNLYFAPVYDFEKRDGKGKLISTYTLPYQTSEADHILDYSRSQQELVFQARNRYVEGSDVKLLYSLNMSAKVVTVDREGRMYDINGNFIGPYYDNLTYEDLHKLKIQDVRGGFYRPPRNGDRIIAISKDGQKKEIKLYPETVGFELQTYNPDPITIDINGTVLSGEYVKIAELKPRENSKLGSLTILVFIPNYASGSESKQSLILKQNEDFIYKDGEIYLTKDGLKKIRDYLSKIGSDNVVLSVEVRSVVSHQNNKEVPGYISITQTQNLILNFKTLEASIRQQGQEVVGMKKEGNEFSFNTTPIALTISAGPNTVIKDYKSIQVSYEDENGNWVPLSKESYEVVKEGENIKVELTNPSSIALYQKLRITGQVSYGNKDGQDIETQTINHTLSVGVLGFELQTYNPDPVKIDIGDTIILPGRYLPIARLKPLKGNQLDNNLELEILLENGKLTLEQNRHFVYENDGTIGLTTEGVRQILSKIGSSNVNDIFNVDLLIQVRSKVSHNEYQQIPTSSIREQGSVILSFQRLRASIRQQGQEVVGMKKEGNEFSFNTTPIALTISAGPNTVIKDYKSIQVSYEDENGNWVPLSKESYEVVKEGENIKVELTNPSSIALYQKLRITGQVSYGNKDGQDIETQTINHTLSVGVLGFELQTYNPDPVKIDIGDTIILPGRYLPIARLKPLKGNQLDNNLELEILLENGKLTLEQNRHFVYENDGTIGLTTEGVRQILSKIGSSNVNDIFNVDLLIQVRSKVSHNEYQQIPTSSIREQGSVILSFQRLRASIRQQGQEVVGMKKEGNEFSFNTTPIALTISAGPNTVIKDYKSIQVSYEDENGNWVPLSKESYEVVKEGENIKVELTNPSSIALYQKLRITGQVSYGNKDGQDIETQTINHTLSVGVLGFELQTYNPDPVKIDIGDTIILPGRYLPIARLKPLKGNQLDNNLELEILLENGKLTLEQNRHFVYENDGTIGLTTEGVRQILSKIGSSNVNDIFNVDLLIQVRSKVSHNEYQQIPTSSIREQGSVILSFQRLRASIRQQGQEVVGMKKEGNEFSFNTTPIALTISAGPNTVIKDYKSIQVSYEDENGNWVPLSKESYEVVKEGENIKVELTNPSSIALYQKLRITGQVSYGNKDGQDIETQTINHTLSVGVLGFELQTYNPDPVKIDIGDTIILPGRYLPIARLKPLKGNQLDNNLELEILLENGKLTLEQNRHFVYENDGTIGLTTEGVRQILSKIGSSNVNDIFNVDLLIQVRSKVSHNEYQQIPTSSIREQGSVILSFQRLRASIRQQGQEVVGMKKEGNEFSFNTTPIALTISAGPNTVIKDYKSIQVSYEDENGNWVPLSKESYEVVKEGENIKVELTNPSSIALYQKLRITGQVSYGNKDGQDIETQTINHTLSVGVLGFELQTYNPDPVKIDIGDTIILPGRYLPIARLKPLKGNQLDNNLELEILLENGKLTLEQNRHFVYENDGTIGLTTEGVRQILSKIGSSNVNDIFNVDLLIQVRSKVSHNEYQQIPTSSIREQGSVILSFQRLRASIRQQGQEVVGMKKEGNEFSFNTTPIALTISAGPNTVIKDYKSIQVSYEDENGNWVPLSKESYEVVKEGENIKVELTNPSSIALYQKLRITGQVSYGNKDGQDIETQTINHTLSVGVLGFELQTYNPDPVKIDIGDTIILPGRYLPIARLKPLKGNQLDNNLELEILLENGKLTLEQNRHFVYENDGTIGLTTEGVRQILSKIGSSNVNDIFNVDLLIQVRSKVSHNEYQQIPTSSIREQGSVILSFQRLRASRVDIKPLEPIIPSIIPIDVIPTVKEFGQNTGGLMGDNTNNNVEKAQKAASALAKLILLQKGSDDPKKLQELQGLGTEFIDNVNGIQFHIPVLSGQSLLKDLLERVLGSPNQQNPAAYTFSLGDLITLARSNDDAKALLGAVLFKDYADSGASEDDLRGIGDAFIKLYNAISNKEFEKINDIIEEINDIINKIPQSPDISFQNSLLYALLPSSVKSTLIVKTKIAEFRINLGEIRGKINEHIDGLVRFSAFLEAGIAYIITRMPDNQQEQTSLIVLSPGIAINSVVWDNENNKYVFELNASALAEFGIGSEPRFFGYRLQFNARGKLKLIQDENITMKINPQASVSVVNGLTSLFAGVDAFVYMGPEIRVESSGISTRPIVLYGGIKGNLSSGTYDARFGAAYNTQLGSGILTLQGQYDLGKGLSLGVNYSTEDFAGQFSYYSNTNRFQVGIEVKLK